MQEKLNTEDKIKALNELFDLLYDEQKELLNDETQEPQLVVPVVDTINSIIAHSLMKLDQKKVELSPTDILTLAEASHVIRNID